MPDPALIPSRLHGLRAWRVARDARGERLVGVLYGDPWPTGGGWKEARCDRAADHAPPEGACTCGVYGWHPQPAAARHVLATRRHVAGVLEVEGRVELHEEGFRAARGRPYAL